LWACGWRLCSSIPAGDKIQQSIHCATTSNGDMYGGRRALGGCATARSVLCCEHLGYGGQRHAEPTMLAAANAHGRQEVLLLQGLLQGPCVVHDSECLALRVGGCQRSSGPQAARCVNVLHGWLACRNGDTRRRWRWRDESGGSVCIERAVGAVVAASREWGDGTCQHAHAVRARGSCALLRVTLVGSCG